MTLQVAGVSEGEITLLTLVRLLFGVGSCMSCQVPHVAELLACNNMCYIYMLTSAYVFRYIT